MKALRDSTKEANITQTNTILKEAGLRDVEVRISRNFYNVILTEHFYRIYFGNMNEPMSMQHCPGTGYMRTMVACGVTISLVNYSTYWMELVVVIVSVLSESSYPCLFSCINSRLITRLNKIPRWRNLYHFTTLTGIKDFKDGRKFEDLSVVR